MSKKKNPSVLAFEKKLVPSDGLMYGTKWEEREIKCSPLPIHEKAVRGTISHRLKETNQEQAKLNKKIENPNLQTVDNCTLEEGQDTLKLHFTLKILSGVETPSACNDLEFNESYREATKNYIKKYKFNEIAKRYAVNIANARFLWRNRVGVENLEVRVKVLNSEQEKEFKFDSLNIGLGSFDSSNSEIDKIAEHMAETLSGKKRFLLLEIVAYAQVGKRQEVYPSQELILDKTVEKSKVLYHVTKQAAMHSQKIGNAIRTIDTWYPDFNNEIGPIAIEPYGSVTSLGKAFRYPKTKMDFYTLFDKYVLGESLNEEEEHYVMATLVRGGIFGESEKEK